MALIFDANCMVGKSGAPRPDWPVDVDEESGFADCGHIWKIASRRRCKAKAQVPESVYRARLQLVGLQDLDEIDFFQGNADTEAPFGMAADR